ncbi:EpsG family protein, partial [Paucibacter sp. TC2R-5]|uniref:EpsG family protein n=1 Tax=Paucibacter sp. TC2R-5 TaxID=2893555 RepID=UPI0021E3AE8E
MLTYWLMFGALAWMAAIQTKPRFAGRHQRMTWPPIWLAVFFLLTALIGLRHEVGGDWFTYQDHVDAMRGTPFIGFWEDSGDPAYALLNWLGANIWGDVYFVNIVCATLFTWGLITFCRHQPRPWLAIVLACPYLIIVVAMGYTRQGVAIGFAMLGLVSLSNGSSLRFFGWILIAALFHKSALVIVPLALFSGSKRPLLTAVGALITGGVLFFLLIQEAIDGLVNGYIVAEYQSAGAFIRVAMNGLPAILFLLFLKRFNLSESDRKFWTWMAVSALGFFVLLNLSASSTAVDRIALYWIPLQLFVGSRLPDVFGRAGSRNLIWTLAVISYSTVTLFFWLFFAE